MSAHIFILGFVQGVGFRGFARSNAQKLGLKGWVKNLSDGRVEITAQGPKETIEKLIRICEKGSFFADVKSIVVDWEEKEEQLEGFEIIHD